MVLGLIYGLGSGILAGLAVETSSCHAGFLQDAQGLHGAILLDGPRTPPPLKLRPCPFTCFCNTPSILQQISQTIARQHGHG